MEVYRFTKSTEKDLDIQVRIFPPPQKTTSTHELKINLLNYIDFESTVQLSPGLYNPHEFEHDIELTEKDIELMLSNSYHAEKKKMSEEMEKMSRRINLHKQQYYKERQKRGICMGNDRLRKEIKELEREIEKKKIELDSDGGMPKLVKIN